MSIADFKSRGNTNFKRTEFIDLHSGRHTIRFLQPKAKTHETHFVRNVTFMCPGDDYCPVCANNRRMFTEFGKEARNMQGFVPQRQVGYINVLDKTVVKICPNTNCQHEVKKNNAVFPTTCPACQTLLTNVVPQPLNKVKVLSKGKQFFDQLEFHYMSILDEETKTPIPFTNYDFSVIVIGGTKVVPTLVPEPENNDPVEVPEDELYDLDKAIIKLNAEEISDLLKGHSLKDIMTSRKPDVAQITNDIHEQAESIFEN